ncbi:VWA domain-containing protein [Mariniblastus sp.]|nr:VWA domain-containing protein [Mariniblastus sp.]
MILAETSFLEWLVGSDPNGDGTPRLQWMNMPESWGVFVLVLVVALIVFGVFWLYRREIQTCPMPVKLTMAGLRLAVLLLLVLMWLKPSVFYQQTSEIKPTISLIRDNSLSIDQTDKYENEAESKRMARLTGLNENAIATGLVKRSDLINGAFDKNPQVLKGLRDKGNVRVVDFATGSKQVAFIAGSNSEDSKDDENENVDDNSSSNDDFEKNELTKIPDLVPAGLGTDIYQAVRESLDSNSRVSALVMVGDGQHNGGEDPIAIAREAASRGVPIYVVGVGDPNPPRNISVNEVYVREKAYPDEPFEVEAILQTTRVGDQGVPSELPIELLQQEVDETSGQLGPATSVQTQTINPPQSGGRIRVDFSHVLGMPGKYVFTVKVPDLAGETNADDNAGSSSMEVVDAKVKVLLVSGLPSWDYQQVTRLLQRDSTIQLSCWLQSMDETRPQEGDAPITQLPQTLPELIEYDVVVLMDPDPKEFSTEWINSLKKFCKDNFGGVMFVAGPQFSGEFVTMNRLQGIRELLPVRFGDSQSIEETEVLAMARDFSASKMLPVKYNMDHPVMSFRSSPVESEQIWSLMPDIYWNFPTLAAKPTARVLLERGENLGADTNQPLLVASRVGSGSVLFMGFQESYRWRRLGVQAQYFDRFWIQSIRYLVESRSLEGARRGFIDLDKKKYELGQRVRFVARVMDSDYEPSTAPSHEAVVRGDNGLTKEVTLKLVPNSSGSYEGSFDAARVGSYEAVLKITGEADETLIPPIDFRVIPPSAEAAADWMHEKLLRQIAQESGGKYLPLSDLKSLPELIPDAVERVDFNSPPQPLWDCSNLLRWSFYLLPVLLLSAEWILRKWFKLL